MSKYFCPVLFFLIATLFLEATVACTGAASSNTGVSPTKYNPASDRMNSLVGIPPESDTPAGGIVPNLAPLVDASILAAANMEASNVKMAARTYLSTNPAPFFFTSDDLQSYVNGTLKAKYYLDPVTALIIRVDVTYEGWIGIVFSLSQQKWIEGNADNNHLEDQDIP